MGYWLELGMGYDEDWMDRKLWENKTGSLMLDIFGYTDDDDDDQRLSVQHKPPHWIK